MSLLRTTLAGARLARVPARAFSTTSFRADVTVPGGKNPTSVGPKFDVEAELDSYVAPPRWSTEHVQPSDVVAGKAAGPATEYETEKEITFDAVSDAPKELRYRQVRIFKPTKNTMQSAKGKTKVWRIDFDVLQGGGRWENPLMGWASSADYMQGTTLAFRTREDAVRFAERQGWDYFVQEPKAARIPPKNYADNYLHVPGKLRIHHTK